MRKFIEKRVRYYDDNDTSEMWLAGFHDPTQLLTVDAQSPVWVTTSEKANFDRGDELEKSFETLVQDGVQEGEFGPRDEIKFSEICNLALDREEDRLAEGSN